MIFIKPSLGLNRNPGFNYQSC